MHTRTPPARGQSLGVSSLLDNVLWSRAYIATNSAILCVESKTAGAVEEDADKFGLPGQRTFQFLSFLTKLCFASLVRVALRGSTQVWPGVPNEVHD